MGVAWERDLYAHEEVANMSMLCQGILVMPLEAALVMCIKLYLSTGLEIIW